MTVTREDLNPCTVLLTVKPTEEQVKKGFERAFKQISKNIKYPGFRPGHAPKQVLETLIPDEQLTEEAANIIVRSAIRPAIEGQDLKVDPTTPPSVDVKELDREKASAEFTIKVPLPPKVELGQYVGLNVVADPVDVTDEEVDFQIEEFRRRRATRENVADRGISEGDVAVIRVHAEKEAGDKTFMVIHGKSFPSLDKALAGMKVEEQKQATLEFPEDFHDKDWAGKKLKGTVTVNSVNSVKLPDLDDEFAKSLQTDNIDDLKERVRMGLLRAKESMQFEVATDQLLDDILAASEIHVSDNMWENLADRRIRETAAEVNQQGKTLEAYVKELGQTVEEFVESWRERAQFEVKRALIIQNVFAKENLGLTQTDLNQELLHMAQEYNVELDEMVNLLQKNKAVDELQFRAIQRKVRAFLLEKAHITESKSAVGEAKPKREKGAKAEKSEAKAEEKPAKKPAAKKSEAKTDEPKEEAAPKKKAPAKKKAE